MKNQPNDRLLSKFQAGLFNEVLTDIEESSALKKNLNVRSLWIGALVFAGELDKAQALFKAEVNTSEALSMARADHIVACRFYLALGLIRQSQYKEARLFLYQNLQALKKNTSPLAQFYIYQGMAFFRFFCGRFFQAQKYAKKSYALAVQSEFAFGELISKDLLAHSSIQLGHVRKGLKLLEENLKKARQIKNVWIFEATEISLLKFKAQFGLHPQTDLLHLQKTLAGLESKDTFSKAELQLEIIRQHLLRGQFSKAEAALADASDIIYKHQNRRQMAVLNLRMAYMLYLQRHITQSQQVLRFAEQNIDPIIDGHLLLQLGGMQELLNKVKNSSNSSPAPKTSLAAKSQVAIHHKIVLRSQTKKIKINLPGEDPLGDLLDKIQQQDSSAAPLIIESGYYGLLYKLFDLPFHEKVLIFDLLPGSLLLLDKGEVTYQKHGFNSILRKILLSLRQGPQSKEQLVENIWGYRYEAHRHDSLIYSAVKKIRKILEPHGDWIVLTEQGYQIHSAVRVIVKNSLKSAPDKVKEKVDPHWQPQRQFLKTQRKKENFRDLNFRQMQIINYLKSHTSIGINELATRLNVSKPTATRDLSHLYQKSILKRIGKGRATRYFLNKSS